MNRWKAAGIHFSLSLVVFLFLLGIILWVWYPGLLFELNGGWEGLRIVMGVDLILGPLLTLIVYKVGKPSLKFDLTAIGLFQAVCLAGGVWLVFEERPVVLAIEYDTVFSLSSREYKDFGNELATLDDFAGPFPKFLSIDLPNVDNVAASISIEKQLANEPLFGDPQFYLPLPTNSENLTALVRDSESVRRAFEAQHDEALSEDCLLAKFASSSSVGYVCIDTNSRTLTAFFD